jgi:hypothetical protein
MSKSDSKKVSNEQKLTEQELSENESNNSNKLMDMDIDVDDVNLDDTDVDQVQVSEEFKQNVIEFLNIDNKLDDYKKKSGVLRKKRKECENFILNFMDSVGEKTVECAGSKLRKNKSETKKKIDNSIIHETLSAKIEDPLVVADIMKAMEQKRPKTTATNLKRTKPRVKKVKGNK